MAQRPTVTQMSRKFESHAFTISVVAFWQGGILDFKVVKYNMCANPQCNWLHTIAVRASYILFWGNFLSENQEKPGGCLSSL